MDLTSILEAKYLENNYGLYRNLLRYGGSYDFYEDINGNKKIKAGDNALNNIDKYRSFILADASCLKYENDILISLKDISLPFDKIFIETPTIRLNFTNDTNLDSIFRNKTPYFLGCFYEEEAPGVVHASTVCLYVDENNHLYSSLWSKVFISEKTYSPRSDGYIQAKILYNLMNFKKDKFITGISKAKEKTRNGREIISDVVIVHKDNASSVASKHCVRIDWKHCWEVSGHFRRIQGLGKDRSGQRRLTNITWVVPHVKGDLDMPLIKKERIYPNLVN